MQAFSWAAVAAGKSAQVPASDGVPDAKVIPLSVGSAHTQSTSGPEKTPGSKILHAESVVRKLDTESATKPDSIADAAKNEPHKTNWKKKQKKQKKKKKPKTHKSTGQTIPELVEVVVDKHTMTSDGVSRVEGEQIVKPVVGASATMGAAARQAAPVEPSLYPRGSDVARVPGILVTAPLAPIVEVPVMDNASGKVPETITVPKERSDPVQTGFDTTHNLQAPQSFTAKPPPIKYTVADLRHYIKSLNLPGISFDLCGVCIAPDAPDWVCGRIVRRVQIIVSNVKHDIQDLGLNQEEELALERKEKTFFGQEMWDRLFKIEERDEYTEEEALEEERVVESLLREFGEKLAAGLIPDVPVVTAQEDSDDEALEMQVAKPRAQKKSFCLEFAAHGRCEYGVKCQFLHVVPQSKQELV
ncbi:hypothetical protein BU23DRAFT_601648 [Bimuria novae-zelandiae CBS 107.79]|uniref:C3H1-type domain-containing protein n=1 Tax=Bimuria novae-zelandiae CBS 107.79 TaxID=1447943 RepID=A0A6A5V7I9_9PLEO|nr:hypothetical protein BU23DRAFT_601648 [Bimuria novae-zelandiae CBS 107.79]